ncbi:MAG: GAF domain-containing protein [Candidatus Zixiibacteriota bacterium]
MENPIIQVREIVAEDTIGEPVSFSQNRITDIFSKSFKSVFKNNQKLSHCFFSLCKKLNKYFSISRAVLVVYSESDDSLKVIALKCSHNSREGLTLTLPKNNSLFYKVFQDGKIFIKDYFDNSIGNFIERKLLGHDECGSLAICPVIFKEKTIGLLCLASPALYAFEILAQGIFDSVLINLGQLVNAERFKISH